MSPSKSCELCSESFVGHRETQRFCSLKCANSMRAEQAWTHTRWAHCVVCGVKFKSRYKKLGRGPDAKRQWTRTCSPACRGQLLFKGGGAASRRRRRYGLEPDAYQKLVDEQHGLCALCRNKPHYDLYVDHNHDTKEVRALLCARCNNIAGVFDQLTWDEVLVHWGYTHCFQDGIDLARAAAELYGVGPYDAVDGE